MTVEPHDHVVLDEAVFHAYQDIAFVASYSRDPSLAIATWKLEAALAKSRANSAADPDHHVR